ncbi:MAG: hypothetical protein QOH91_1877 [Mycobacterium sp.]|nr:hypothetical protein [Mycobacterium sp.]
MKEHLNNTAVGWAAIALGLATAVTPAWATTTPAGAGFTLGLGAITIIYGMWSLIARDPTRDHWSLSVVGLVLAIAPWVGGFAGDGAAWVAWTTGLLLMLLAGTAYINDEAANASDTLRVKQLATYLAQHPQSPPNPELPPTGREQPHVHDVIGSSAVAFLPIRPRAGAE